MFWKLFLGFTLIPVLEIYFLIKLGSYFGAFTTILIVIGTGILGAYLVRIQGIKTMFQVRENVNQGIMPAEDLIDAFIIIVAGVVLLTPGFITDTIGFLLLIPTTRTLFKKWLRHRLEARYIQKVPQEPPKNVN